MSNILTDRNTDADAALVASAREGELAAFEALVAKHQKRMQNIAFRIIGDYDDACEVVQDTFVSAYRNLKGFRAEAKFSTWLTAITVNLSKNRLKRVIIKQKREPVSLDAPIRTDEGEVMPDPPSKEPSVLDRMENEDVKKKVSICSVGGLAQPVNKRAPRARGAITLVIFIITFSFFSRLIQYDRNP